MQTTSATLAAAARARQRQPVVNVLVMDKERRWEILHSEGTDSEFFAHGHRGTVTATNVARIKKIGARIYRQRVTDITDAGQWWSWTEHRTTLVAISRCALGWGFNNRVNLYYWENDGTNDNIYRENSASDGNGYAGRGAVETVTAAVGDTVDSNYCLATASNSDFWYLRIRAGSKYISGKTQDLTTGTWSSRISGPADQFDFNQHSGLAAAYDAAEDVYIFVVTFMDTAGKCHCEMTTYDVGASAWSDPVEIAPVGGAVPNLQLHSPALCWGADGQLHLSVIELWTDLTNYHYSQVVWRCIPGRDPHNYGVWGWPSVIDRDPEWTLLSTGPNTGNLFSYTDAAGKEWLFSPAEWDIYRARVYKASDSDTYRKLTDVIHVDMGIGERSGYAIVDLANDKNKYKNYGQNTQAGASIRPFAQVVLELGYKTSAGDETLKQVPMWVETSEIIYRNPLDGSPSSRLRLYCVSIWQMLRQWTAPYDMAWTNTGADYLLRVLLARAAAQPMTHAGGFPFDEDITDYTISQGPRQGEAWRWRSEWIPEEDGIPTQVYTVERGTTALEQVYKLLRLTGTVLRQSPDNGTEQLQLNRVDAADYAIGTNGEIQQATYGRAAAGPIRARVRGSTSIAIEDTDTATPAYNGRLIESIEDLIEHDNQALAENMTAHVIYQGMSQTQSGYVIVPCVPGLQLYDRVTIADPDLPATLKARVGSLRIRYDARKHVYTSQIGLLAR